MSKLLRVLNIDDSEDDARLLLRRLSKEGFEVKFERVETPQAMAAALSDRSWDIVISDYAIAIGSKTERARSTVYSRLRYHRRRTSSRRNKGRRQ